MIDDVDIGTMTDLCRELQRILNNRLVVCGTVISKGRSKMMPLPGFVRINSLKIKSRKKRDAFLKHRLKQKRRALTY
jgi:hypothetical protein